MASLWPVDDRAGEAFARAFYHRCARGEMLAVAYRGAVNQLRRVFLLDEKGQGYLLK